MEIYELEDIFSEMVKRSEKLIHANKRDLIKNNERFFHHMFSNLIYDHYSKKKEDIFNSLFLIPEYPTKNKFSWKYVKEFDEKKTKKFGINRGKSGKFDFALLNKPPIYIEWKGPNLYNDYDMAKDLLKLLTQDEHSIKIIAAIILSSKKGGKNHVKALKSHFNEGMRFAKDVLEIENLQEKNLYGYIATIPDDKIEKIVWNKINTIIK